MAKERDWLALYNLETYVMSTVHGRFHAQGSIEAFDFFCIVAWKANRARSKVAAQLLRRSQSLDMAVRQLTLDLSEATENEARFRLLIEKWGLRLPMASAILTVLYPDEFTVYDQRVCEQLGAFASLAERKSIDGLWAGYLEYMESVHAAAPNELSLREKDRWLWAKSFGEGLSRALESEFSRRSD